MSVVMKAFNAMDAKDIDTIAAILHGDFVYFDDFEMRNRDDWLDGIKEFFLKEDRFDEDRRVLCDTRDCYAKARNSVWDRGR